ncbi:MAG: hypothetical protein HUU50_18905, partial [Candidatus Brocadiae bacterium]|nr:hypothetical protein [Candidatus Brocadiia bacterium]
EEEKSNWDQERESAREKLAQIQQEWTQEKEKLTQEWNQKEQSYLSEIQKLKDNQPAADSTQEWTQEKEKLTQEWNQKEQSYLSEIQKLKDNPLEKKPKDVVVEERKEIPPLSPEKLEKIHTRLDKAITKMRFGLYREMKSTPYIKECLDIYHGIAGTFLK